MPLDYPRSLGPGVREVIGDDPLDEIAVDEGVALLRPAIPGRSLLLAHQRPPDTDAVLDETDRLTWLAGRAGAPDVIASGRADEGDEALVVRLPHDASSGIDGHPMGPEALATSLAGMLRELHDLPTRSCPFDASVDVLRGRAARRIERGLVTRTDEGPYARRPPVDLLALHGRLELSDTAPTVIHGALRAERVWLSPDGSAAFTGWRGAGVGDPHIDLAAAAAIVHQLHGPALVGPLLDAYGLDRIDLARLDAAQLLVHLLT
ncbi:MAG: phosphotransferase [Actinomycetota bacterium]